MYNKNLFLDVLLTTEEMMFIAQCTEIQYTYGYMLNFFRVEYLKELEKIPASLDFTFCILCKKLI